MCVIITGTDKRPSLRDLRACELQNPDGAGIAWSADGAASFEKGLDAEQVHRILRGLPKGTPYVVHFRYATVGEPEPGLTHPFPIGARTSLRTSGRQLRRVLFHNGTWPRWKAALSAVKGKRPAGPWSDSRALAFLLSKVGEVWLDEIDCKFAVLHGDGVRVYPSDQTGWTERDGILYSNTYWMRRLPQVPSGKSKEARPTQGKSLVTLAEEILAEARAMALTSPQPDKPRRLTQRR